MFVKSLLRYFTTISCESILLIIHLRTKYGIYLFFSIFYAGFFLSILY